MKKKHKKGSAPVSSDGSFEISDGSTSSDDYDAGDYSKFLSNGRTNNEKVEAEEYYDRFLHE